MKFYIPLLLLFYAVIPVSYAQQAKIITASDLIKLQHKEQKVQILDVRTLPELEAGIIKGSINIDFFKEDFSKKVLKLNPTLPVVVYCASGGRSAKAAEFLKLNGYSNVYDLQGGFMNWKKNGNPIVYIK